MPGFTRHSYDWDDFDAQTAAVVTRRVPLEAGRRADDWPWPDKQIFVLTSRPLPADTPADVVVADNSPKGLLRKLRAAKLERDAFLLGGRRTLLALVDSARSTVSGCSASP
jgi:dihydrofolate reductase